MVFLQIGNGSKGKPCAKASQARQADINENYFLLLLPIRRLMAHFPLQQHKALIYSFGKLVQKIFPGQTETDLAQPSLYKGRSL